MQSSDQARKQDPGPRVAGGVDDCPSGDEVPGSYVREQTRYAREQKDALWIGVSLRAALSAVVASLGVAGFVAGAFG